MIRNSPSSTGAAASDELGPSHPVYVSLLIKPSPNGAPNSCTRPSKVSAPVGWMRVPGYTVSVKALKVSRWVSTNTPSTRPAATAAINSGTSRTSARRMPSLLRPASASSAPTLIAAPTSTDGMMYGG